MSLSETYREYLIEKIILTYLYDGEIPTPDQVEIDLATYQETHPDLSVPSFKYKDLSVERGEGSSADKIKEITSVFTSDTIPAIREIYNVASINSRYYDRWQRELSRLNIRAKRLEDKVDSLLLLTNNTEGYFGAVEDNFADMSLVDTENTTASVNSQEQRVTLNAGSEIGTITQINTTKLTSNDVAFYPLNRDSSTRYYPVGIGNNLHQVFKTENTSWVGKIVSSKPGSMTSELKAKISSEDQEISKVSVVVYSPNTSNRSTITIQYSTDGYNWFLPSTLETTKSFKGVISWSFPPISLRWIKFIIYKPYSDSSNLDHYEYMYSIRSIKLFSNAYHETRGTLFYSSSLSAENADGDTLGFFKAELNTCQFTPNETSIRYSLAASKDNSTWTDWHEIVPFDDSLSSLPKVVNFAGISLYDNTLEDTDTVYSSLEAGQLTSLLDDSDVQYRFTKPNIAIINTKIVVPSTIEENIVANTIQVWRNIRVPDSYPDTYKVRDVARGWTLEGQKYSCYFEILSASGRIVDFGDRSCIIDGQERTGIVNLASGVHKFETLAENWHDISNDISNITNESYLQSIDPLYPHNHKLLIEGIPYPVGFEGEQIYFGMDLSAAYYCTRTTMFNLYEDSSKFNVFAIKNIGTSDNILGVFMRYDPNNTDYINEYSIIKWQSADTNVTSYKYIKLKAELSSDNTDVSPEITGYRIKLGA